MVKLVLLAGLLVLIAILAAPRRKRVKPGPLGSPQQAYLRLHNDDEVIAKP